MKKLFFVLFLLSGSAQAIIVENVQIVRLYVQSPSDSAAHAVSIDKSIDSSCNSRLYINTDDDALLSTVLAYKLSGQTFHLMYQKNEPSKLVRGHLHATCRLFSIY